MPELPEVETIRRGLSEVIINKRIIDFKRFDQKVVRFRPEQIKGLKIDDVKRRAKILIFNLSGRHTLLIHLKLTGQLIWRQASEIQESNKFTRAIFYFDDHSSLIFNDMRRFGYLKLYDQKIIDNLPELSKLGPEPFSKDFNLDYLLNKSKQFSKRKIKQFIMDQEIISGVGNIYADEALFDAKILPTRLASGLKLPEWNQLQQSIIKVLNLGLHYGGSSNDSYVNAFGQKGEMDQHVAVYRRTGKPCVKCGGKIKRISLGGRGTHFCPVCQH